LTLNYVLLCLKNY